MLRARSPPPHEHPSSQKLRRLSIVRSSILDLRSHFARVIVVVSFGEPKIEEVLRTAAVMAADRALLGTRQVIGPLATAWRMVAVKSRISSVVGNRRSTTTPIRPGKGFLSCSGGA